MLSSIASNSPLITIHHLLSFLASLHIEQDVILVTPCLACPHHSCVLHTGPHEALRLPTLLLKAEVPALENGERRMSSRGGKGRNAEKRVC